jgi:hypothetical protein
MMPNSEPRRVSHLVRYALTAAAMAVLLAGCGGPAAPATTALPYADDFSNPQSGWVVSTDLSGETNYADGRMRILVKNENLSIWSTAGKNFADGVYSVEAQPIGGPTDNGYGVVFRLVDRQNFYFFELSSDGYWRSGITKDGATKVWGDWLQHPAIKLGGDMNQIKIEMRGETLKFFVNDQLISTREQAVEFKSGDIGVVALTVIDKPGTEIAFDNASVTALP